VVPVAEEALELAVTAETVMVMAAKAVAVATAAFAARAAVRSHKIRSKPGPTLAPGPSCSPRSSFRSGFSFEPGPELGHGPRPNPWYKGAMPAARMTTILVRKIN
jgi:hypothetical protein